MPGLRRVFSFKRMFRTWLKKSQENGWRLAGVTARECVLQCSAHGCSNEKHFLLDTLGQAPTPCEREHVNGYGKPAYDDYTKIVLELQRRRTQIGINQDDLDTALGVADGYIAKLESGARTPSPVTLIMWAQAVGVEIHFKPAILPPATLKVIEQRQTRPYEINQARFKHDR